MSLEEPKTLDEWQEHIGGLSGMVLRNKVIAANTYMFVQTLQGEGYGPDDITAIFRMMAAQFVKTGQEPPSTGYLDLAQICRKDPELKVLYQSLSVRSPI